MKDVFFEKSRDSIYKELIRANNNLSIFDQLYQEIVSDQYDQLPKKYKPYFRESMTAHYDVFVISIYNVTKNDDQTGNFRRLFEYISCTKLSRSFDSDKVDQMNKKIDSIMDTVNKLHIIRDQYITHNQLNKSSQSTVHTVEQCHEILSVLNDVLVQLSIEYDGGDLSIPANLDFKIPDLYQDLIGKNKR